MEKSHRLRLTVEYVPLKGARKPGPKGYRLSSRFRDNDHQFERVLWALRTVPMLDDEIEVYYK